MADKKIISVVPRVYHQGKADLINDQYRVTFRWENGHAYEVRVEDYH